MMARKPRVHRVIEEPKDRVILLDRALDEFILSLRARSLSPQTLHYYDQNVRRFITWCADNGHPRYLEGIQVVHIRHWLNHLQASPSVSDVSVQTYFRAIRAWFNWAEREELLEGSPFRNGKLKMPKAATRIKPSYSQDELRAFLEAAVLSANPLRDTAMFLVLIDTAIRNSELVGLKLADLERGRLRVMGKGAKERFVNISPLTEKAIRDYVRKVRRVTTDDIRSQSYLFIGPKGPLTTSGLLQVVKRAARRVGITDCDAHKFRHSFAKHWAMQGAPLQALQAILGHESPAMSMKYGKMASADTEDLHRQFSPVKNLGRRN